MINSPLELSFKAVAHPKLNPSNQLTALEMIENDAENIPTKTLNLDFIAPYLHQIYTSSDMLIRSSVLHFISFFEVNSEESIIEKYHFDKLVVLSIEQKVPEIPPKVDEERISAFRIVLILIKIRRYLPISIVRSLVSLYYTPKHTMKNLVANYLCEAVLMCDDFPTVSEVPQILVENLVETNNQNIADLLNYIFEKQYIFMKFKHFSNSIVSPISQHFKSSTYIENSYCAIIRLLRTWPGLFSFGIKSGALIDLIRILKHSSNLISLFTQLLFIDGPKNSVVEGYTGFLIYYLIQNGLIEILTELSPKNLQANQLLQKLTLFATHSGKTPTLQVNMSTTEINENEQSSPSLLKISQCLTNSKAPNSISLFVLPEDELQWDWNEIRMMLTVVLAHNDGEAQSQMARTFYNRLIDIFSAPSLPNFSANNYVSISECISAFIELLMPKQWGRQLLIENQQFSSAILIALHAITTQKQINQHHPIWAFVECFCKMMVSSLGISILQELNIINRLDEYGNKFSDIKAAVRLLKMIDFYPESSLATAFFQKFLRSSSIEISTAALDELRNKSKTTPDFDTKCLSSLILPFIHDICNGKLYKGNNQHILNVSLNLLCEMMTDNEDCKLIVANVKGLPEIIQQNSHEMFSLLFSNSETHPYLNVDEEIKYWMEVGIYEYVKTFDKASYMTFEKKFEALPSIICSESHALIPSHLFGQLAKTKSGYEKLLIEIPHLLEICKTNSIKKQRAAFFALGHFGSIGNNATPEIVDVLIQSALNSNSHLLMGTLITVLSIMKPNPAIVNFWNSHGFIIYDYGTHSCVIPIDQTIDNHFGEHESDKIVHKVYPKAPNPTIENIIQLQNPIAQNQAKKEIYEASKSKDFLKPEVAFYANDILSYFSLAPEARMFIFNIFRSVPLMNLPNYQINQKVAAECVARAIETANSNQMMLAVTPFTELPIPNISASDLNKQRPNCLVPEVYISDADFSRIAGFDKTKFYNLDEDQQYIIRKKIMMKT
ncbi:hypothetical protein TRFO_13254 [Tritrichomonas foetus]|uniref:Rapamycin-insensitive companion of mTOR N-terminal domain-containing protein n=1 Tax=Tritrichomonas foetus TaxID=1144522 RepID=A0A1J4KZU8_9EUKA|nr:hypothetical protein TRFO_13254 [Tritrichomonas foetus]|eukprot:OHT16392.1 hypothetical protein TRFO_13254 [Tritrichomonas foetus]